MDDMFKKWSNKFCWVLIVIGLLMNVFGFWITAKAAPSPAELDFDYNGVIVGVLSLLVTALLGWNVYSLIDLKNNAEQNHKINDELNKIKTDNNNGYAEVERTLASLFSDKEILNNKSVRTYYSLQHWVRYFTIKAKMEDYNLCYKAIEDIKRIYDKNCSMYYYDKKEIETMAKNIPNRTKINNIKTLDITIKKITESSSIMEELKYAAFEALKLFPGSSQKKWINNLIKHYPTEVADAFGVDKNEVKKLLVEMWTEPYTDIGTKQTNTYAQWAKKFSTQKDVDAYYEELSKNSR